MYKFIYRYCVKSYFSDLYISNKNVNLLTDNRKEAKLYFPQQALKVAKNAERLFRVKFCIEMQCREYIVE